MAQKKKQLVAAGKLDKFGRPNESTPQVCISAVKVCWPWLYNSRFWHWPRNHKTAADCEAKVKLSD